MVFPFTDFPGTDKRFGPGKSGSHTKPGMWCANSQQRFKQLLITIWSLNKYLRLVIPFRQGFQFFDFPGQFLFVYR